MEFAIISNCNYTFKKCLVQKELCGTISITPSATGLDAHIWSQRMLKSYWVLYYFNHCRLLHEQPFEISVFDTEVYDEFLSIYKNPTLIWQWRRKVKTYWRMLSELSDQLKTKGQAWCWGAVLPFLPTRSSSLREQPKCAYKYYIDLVNSCISNFDTNAI